MRHEYDILIRKLAEATQLDFNLWALDYADNRWVTLDSYYELQEELAWETNARMNTFGALERLHSRHADTVAELTAANERGDRLVRMRETERETMRGFIGPDFNSHPVDAMLIMEQRVKRANERARMAEEDRVALRDEVLTFTWAILGSDVENPKDGDVKEAIRKVADMHSVMSEQSQTITALRSELGKAKGELDELRSSIFIPPASRESALKERLERAEKLLKDAAYYAHKWGEECNEHGFISEYVRAEQFVESIHSFTQGE